MSDGNSSKFAWMTDPPRALRSAGVAGLLLPESQVFFLTLFDSRSVGRVSDLLAARLARAGIAESGMREVLAILTEAVAGRAVHGGVSVEVGLDADVLAIGWSWSPGAELFAEVVSNGEAVGWLARLLGRLRRSTSGVVLKIRPGQSAIEVAAILRHGSDQASDAESEILSVVLDGENEGKPEVAFYQELGDEDSAGDSLPVRAGARAGSVASAVVEVSSNEAHDADAQRKSFSSEAVEEQPEARRFSGEALDAEGIEVSGAEEAANGERLRGELNPEDARSHSDTIVLLRKKVETLEEERDIWKSRVLSSDPPALEEEILVSEPAESAPELVRVSGSEEGSNAESQTLIRGGSPGAGGDVASTVAGGDSATLDEADREMIVVREKPRKKPKGFFGRLFSRGDDDEIEDAEAAGGGASTVSGEASDTRGKRMAEGMMTEVMAEKARLAEAQREMERSLKQKEFEFRRKLNAASREIRDREDEIRTRDAQIVKLKEQMGNAIKTAERMKEEVENVSLDAGFKQKYLTAERVVQTLRAENARLERQGDELKAQQIAATVAAKSKEKGAMEAQQLRDQMARLQKQCEDLRRINQQLSEKTARQNAGPGNVAIEELRRKAEASVRVAATHRKEADALRMKMESLRKEEARLRVEVGRLQSELKRRGGGAPPAASAPAAASPPASPAAGTPPPGKKAA